MVIKKVFIEMVRATRQAMTRGEIFAHWNTLSINKPPSPMQRTTTSMTPFKDYSQ